MQHHSAMITAAVTLLAVTMMTSQVEGLNLADVPCGSMGSGSRRYFQRITGGTVADISDFPYAVSIKKHGEHHCGGSLVRFLLNKIGKLGFLEDCEPVVS